MIFLGSRIFTTKDTIAFSKLSKDKNRIHFDNKICNFTQYNNPIVQGALILISIFLLFKKKYLNKDQYIQSFDAIFKEPVFVNEKVKFFFKKNAENHDLIITNGISKKIIIKTKVANNNLVPNSENNLYQHLMSISKFAGNYKNKINLITLISVMSKNINENKKKFRELNSKLINFNLINNKYESSTNFISNSKVYKKNKFKLINNGKIPLKNLNDKKILVIGGNSGLGEIITKYLSNKNLNITFTYNNNLKNAKILHHNLNKMNKNINFIKLNEKIIKKSKIKRKLIEYNYIYFFPTPKIFNFSKDYFDLKKFNKFNNIYIDFLKKIIEILIHSDNKYHIYVPSTQLLNTNYNNSEYAMSKLVQERLCKKISKNSDNINIINPRLKAYYTKSTHQMLQNEYSYNSFIESALKIFK